MFTIREATIDDLQAVAKVHVDSWKTTYEGIVPQSYLNTLSYQTYEQMWREYLGEEPLFVAQIDAQIVGFAKAGKAVESTARQFEAELFVLYVLQPFQGRGIGRALFQQVVQYLKGQQMSSLFLYVLKQNIACQFYEKLGAQLVAEEETEIGGAILTEFMYAWDNI